MPSTAGEWFVQILIFVLVGYPIVGGLAFIVSSFYYRLFLEKHDLPRPLEHEPPFVTIFVPAHNEEASIASTVEYLFTQLNYPLDKYEVMVLNDGSTDRTPDILEQLQTRFTVLRVVSVVANRGKAAAFNLGLGFARGDFILSNDADTKPNPDALWQYMSYFERPGGHNVGAVTGNMLAANRTTMTALAQQNELNSIIGIIKRGQMAIGSLFAFSGANTMYRRQAVLDVGGWHPEQPTEDIANAWDMQTMGWRAIFAAHIRFFLDVPEKLVPLIKQRRRWSSGGIMVLLTKGPRLLRHPVRNYRMIPVIVDYSLSIVWSFFYWVSMAIFVLLQIFFLATLNWERFFHNWFMVGIFVAIEMIVGAIQVSTASYYNDGGKTLKYLLFAPWYMLVYWMVNTYTVVVEFIPTVRKTIQLREGGVWKSPERSASLTKDPRTRGWGSGDGVLDRAVPDYMTHSVDERDLTVDWFFGHHTFREKLPQLLAAITGWIFSILPIVITTSAIVHRNDRTGRWQYREGFVMFDVTCIILGILLGVFVLGYFVLLVMDRRQDGWRRDDIIYDVERLDLRLAIAEDLYAEKFGPEDERIMARNIRIEPFADLETYELRDRYRDYDVGVE